MNKQVILSILLVIGFATAMLMYFSPNIASKIPGIGDVIETNYYANVEVEIDSGGWISGRSVSIKSVNLEQRLFSIMVGPLWLWPSEIKGRLVIESLHNGNRIDFVEIDYDVSEGWLETGVKKRYTGSVKLGLADSGTYIINVTIYDQDGQLKGETQTTRTI